MEITRRTDDHIKVGKLPLHNIFCINWIMKTLKPKNKIIDRSIVIVRRQVTSPDYFVRPSARLSVLGAFLVDIILMHYLTTNPYQKAMRDNFKHFFALDKVKHNGQVIIEGISE